MSWKRPLVFCFWVGTILYLEKNYIGHLMKIYLSIVFPCVCTAIDLKKWRTKFILHETIQSTKNFRMIEPLRKKLTKKDIEVIMIIDRKLETKFW